MTRLHRTQIYLPPDLSAALDKLARRRRTSRAELLRQAAGDLLRRELTADEDPILGVIGLGNAGPGAVSEEHDKFLAEQSARSARLNTPRSS
jgi:predicted transcriptional regulator